MPVPRLDYDPIAPEYNRRYPSGELTPRGEALLELAQRTGGRALEAGCGTGHWLSILSSITNELYGLDFSLGMLHQAQKRALPRHLVRGTALRLPFEDDSFGLVYCMDAFHHFAAPHAFLAEALRVLRPGGALAVSGDDPHAEGSTWYVYDCFEGVYATDLARFPSSGALSGWMEAAGFVGVESKEVQHIHKTHSGREVLSDPFLKKNSCSQLALLSDEAYQAGLRKIEAVLAEAESRGETPLFRTEVSVPMVAGYKAKS